MGDIHVGDEKEGSVTVGRKHTAVASSGICVCFPTQLSSASCKIESSHLLCECLNRCVIGLGE